MIKLLSIKDVAALLNVSTESVNQLIRSGELPHVDIGPRMTRVDKNDLKNFIAVRRKRGKNWAVSDASKLATNPKPALVLSTSKYSRLDRLLATKTSQKSKM